MPGECDFKEHVWGGSENRIGSVHTTHFACQRCGVGHDLRIDQTGTNQLAFSVYVFPASGTHTISRGVVRYFAMTCAATESNAHSQGFDVEHGGTVIDAVVDESRGGPFG